MSSTRANYYCGRFEEGVEKDRVIRRALDLPDETEWFLTEGGHIYYCRFCGALIKGDGFGTYDEKHPRQR